MNEVHDIKEETSFEDEVFQEVSCSCRSVACLILYYHNFISEVTHCVIPYILQ